MEANERQRTPHEVADAGIWVIPEQQDSVVQSIGMSGQAEITAPNTPAAAAAEYAGWMATAQAAEHADDSPATPPVKPSRDVLRGICAAVPEDIDLSGILTQKQMDILPDLLGGEKAIDIGARLGMSDSNVTRYTQQIIRQLASHETTQPYVPAVLVPDEPEPAPPIERAVLPPPPPPPDGADAKAAVAEGKARLSLANDGKAPSWALGQPREVLTALHAMGFDVVARLPETQHLTRDVVREVTAGATGPEIAQKFGISVSQVNNNVRIAADIIAYTVPRNELPPAYMLDGVGPPVAHPEKIEPSLRDRMRTAVNALESQGLSPSDFLPNEEQALLPGLMSRASYTTVGRAAAVDKSTAMYHTYNIVQKAERAIGQRESGTAEVARPASPPSSLREHIRAAAAILRENGVDPVSLMDSRLQEVFGRIDGTEPNGSIQRDLGMVRRDFIRAQEVIMRRMTWDKRVRGLVPASLYPHKLIRRYMSPQLVEAIRATRAEETSGPPGTRRYWSYGQQRQIIGELTTRGFDPRPYIPASLSRVHQVVGLVMSGHDIRGIRLKTGLPKATVYRLVTQAVDIMRHTIPKDELPEGTPPDLFVPKLIR